ncbi:MAG TPA: hypothetical protein VM889_09765 [Candidatus Thermoplasmatota archaeon]|nr:hypothetical protein [Candidatus Thermoplasmatota archaeon]
MKRVRLHGVILLAALLLAGCTSATDLPGQRRVPITAVWAENVPLDLGPGEVGNVSFRIFEPATAAWNWSADGPVEGCLLHANDLAAWTRGDVAGEACRRSREANGTFELLRGDYVLALRCDAAQPCALHVSLQATPHEA